MAQIAVGEGVRGGLEPDDNRVDFGESADEGVVDVVVYDNRGDEEAETCVEAVQPGDQLPRRAELLAFGFGGCWCIGAGSPIACRKLRLSVLCRGELDDVCCEKMTGYYEEERGSDEEVLSFVVMASQAYENSILWG